MRLWKKVATIVIASTMLFGWSGSLIFASSNNSVSENFYQDNVMKTTFEKMNDIAKSSDEVKDSQRIQDIKNMSKDVISNKKVMLQNLNANLDFDNANSLDIKQNNKEYTLITIPIMGDQYSLMSNLTLVFDSHNNVINYSETLIEKSENNKFTITSYLDGELVQNKVTDLDFISNDELKKGLENIQDYSKGIKQNNETKGVCAIAACIGAVAGVNLTVAYLIAGTCIASCPAVPPICAACIAGVATIGAADIGGIIACFNL